MTWQVAREGLCGASRSPLPLTRMLKRAYRKVHSIHDVRSVQPHMFSRAWHVRRLFDDARWDRVALITASPHHSNRAGWREL